MIKHQKGDINVCNLDKGHIAKAILQMQRIFFFLDAKNLSRNFGGKLIVEFFKSFWKHWGEDILRLLVKLHEHT